MIAKQRENAMPFDPKKPVQTRDGYPARILATDVQDSHPIVAAVTRDDGKEIIRSYCSDGHYLSTVGTSVCDLVNIPERCVRWVNLYRGALYPSKEEARFSRGSGCIAAVEVTFIEGEGLDG